MPDMKMSARDVDLQTALARIGSSNANERKEGLADLEYLFQYNKNSHVLDSFKDKTWHSVYEALFKCAAAERSAYLRSTESQKIRATPRLIACGKALRITVIAGVKRIKAKTVKAVVDHILQTLPVQGRQTQARAEGPYFPGLGLDYVKTLRIILECQPHVEHFRDSWQQVLDFCLNGLAPLGDHEGNELESDSEPSATAGASVRTASMSLTRRSRAVTPQGRRSRHSSVFRKEIDDLVACIHQLLRATNAPIAGNEIDVVKAMTDFLSLSDSFRPSYNDAFAAINAILFRLAKTSIQLTRAIILSVVPLVKDLWSRKSASLRDEMLVALILTQDHVSALVSDISEANFRIDLENLVETMQTDYSKRLERDQLHLGDLVLDCTTSLYGKSNLKLPIFGLRRGRIRAEPLWTIVYLTASYMASLDKIKNAIQGRVTDFNDQAPSKRTRMTSLLHRDILRSATSSPTPATRIASLQYLCFFFQLVAITREEMKEMLEPLALCVVDQNGNVARWALLALSSLVAQSSAQHNEMKSSWADIVPQVIRQLTVEACSRTAAYLLYLLLDLHLAKDVDITATATAILDSLELQGPTSVSDASLALLGWLIEARTAENPGTAAATTENLISWVMQRWSPSSFHDKDVASSKSSSLRPIDLVNFLGRCRGQLDSKPAAPVSLCGSLGRAWCSRAASADLTGYLLLEGGGSWMATPTQPPSAQASTTSAKSPLSISLKILDGLEAETVRTSEIWERIATERPQSLLPAMVETVLGLVIVNTVSICHHDQRIARRLEGLRRKSEILTRAVMNVLANEDCEIERVDVALITTADHLPILSEEMETNDLPNDFTTLCVHLSNMLQHRHQSKTKAVTSQSDMDVELGFESQHSEFAEEVSSAIVLRDAITLSTNQASFRRLMTTQVYLITALLKSSVEHGHLERNKFSHEVTTYITQLPSYDFFSLRQIFLDVLNNCRILTTEDIEELFDHLASYLSAYEYSRHEVALLLHIDLLQATISHWTSLQHVNLNELASQAYEWFVETALKHQICSVGVKVGLLDLFSELFRTCGPLYVAYPGSASVRTTLVDLLKVNERLQPPEIPLLYRLIQILPGIFHQFTLETHEEVFQDIHKCSMYPEAWLEGNVLRLLLFSKLGTSWSTLTRRCVYHIFETAGAIKQTVVYATRCIHIMTKNVQLPESRSFFRLFAGQILYTWTRQTENPWDNIPFSIFEYSSLQELLFDVREEVYAQVMLRNDTNELVKVASMIGLGQSELASSSFARTLAYSLAIDADPKSKRKNPEDRSETRLRSLTGSHFSMLCATHLAKALGILLFRTNFEKRQQRNMDQNKAYSNDSIRQETDESPKEVFESVLELRISNEKAGNEAHSFEISTLRAFREMRRISSSALRLPDPQQPDFRAKSFFDVADRLARRARISLATLFNPAVYVFVFRLLLSSLHHSLGSLQACLIVRKIRLLVALSGSSSLSGYPLEITLYSLRRLLTDKQCTEDALGIVQYLYTHGIKHLQQELRFVTGMNVTTLISLRKFVGSSQESTTQESQHRATIDRANAFRKWLIETWTKAFADGLEDHGTFPAYKRLVSLAWGTGAKANALIGNPESDLIRHIFDDRKSHRSLLPPAAWNLSLQLLCQDFVQPTSYREDFLGQDQQANTYSEEIWASVKNSTMNADYLQWAARVLGRARKNYDFEATALLDIHNAVDSDTGGNREENSLKAIVSPIVHLLFSGDPNHAGVAEETLRMMLFRTSRHRDILAQLQEEIPSAVLNGLALMTEDTVVPINTSTLVSLESCFETHGIAEYDHWIRKLTASLITFDAEAEVVSCLDRILVGVPGIAEKLFAPVLHLVLEQTIDNIESVRHILSKAFQIWLLSPPNGSSLHIRAILRALLYLRKQPYPRETTHADRLKWLDVDFAQAARAAHTCGMQTAALLFAELTNFAAPTKGSKRSTATIIPSIDEDTMLEIYRHIDDPDSFYGVPQPPSLDLVLSRLDHEAEGFRGLMFRGARLDSQMRMKNNTAGKDNAGLVKSLAGINMNAIAYKLLSGRNSSSSGALSVDTALKTAMSLEQWDVRVPETTKSDSATLYRVFQSISSATDMASVRKDLDAGLLGTIQEMLDDTIVESAFRSKMNVLGVLSEVDNAISSTSEAQLTDAWTNIQSGAAQLISASQNEVNTILSSREILMGTLSSNNALREAMHVSLRTARQLQTDALLTSSRIWSRRHGRQHALEAVTCLTDLVPISTSLGFDVTKVVQNATADVLWAQGEHATSIRLLQILVESRQQKNDQDDVHLASLLAKLGHRVAEARFESPNQIMDKYLERAIRELKEPTGKVAGEVYHQFATFCYDQLQNQENLDDLSKAEKLKMRREAEVASLTAEIRGMRSQGERKMRESDLSKARRWLRLDKAELERLSKIREKLTEQCLENYMLALAASDAHDNDALRFYAIWLENASSDLANTVVNRHLDKIASHKFARLMNQLSSRMQADNTSFQKLLGNLVLRICAEHPFHGMHHITAGMHDPGTTQDSSKLRQQAAKQIAQRLKADKGSLGKLWQFMYQSDRLYHDVARYTDEEVQRQGREIRLDKIQPTKRLLDFMSQLQTPPPTLSVPLRPDMDYKDVPRVVDFLPTMRVAGGLSAPKIITSKLSNGAMFKQLFKGGNDDLRQDAIMEQVFEEVSKLLGNHTSTRQRKLRIRTYNVLPLSNHSGVLEFAQNTIALQDALVPLHQVYHPKDLKSSACRSKIADAARSGTEERIKAYKDVCRQFQPAMRYFFFERYADPDQWFERRLAYTRSTAAMSILGHVIGLGDRHLHNILLDYVTGEVVHIDLGVCFEAGRVLPIPEVVPFRLTRDLVDGMGYTRTEGVYRRCCEFTLEALREEVESIMTLLNVLRYDPLYSWTVSAAKAKRMQEGDEMADRGANEARLLGEYSSKKKDDDMGEAGRALAAVEKKLSKTLSKEATVSELIAQATDERNLALLFAGWSAWV